MSIKKTKLLTKIKKTKSLTKLELQKDNLSLQQAIDKYNERAGFAQFREDFLQRSIKRAHEYLHEERLKYERLEVLVLAFVMALVLFAGVVL